MNQILLKNKNNQFQKQKINADAFLPFFFINIVMFIVFRFSFLFPSSSFNGMIIIIIKNNFFFNENVLKFRKKFN